MTGFDCAESKNPGDHDICRRFLAAARERFASEPDADMAISEYARRLMTEALDEGIAVNSR